MPHQTPRLGLRRRGLPLALACALAAGVGGCSTWRMHDLAWFGSSRSYCTSDEAWPTKVKGSLQRAETGWETTRYEPEERSEPEAEAWSKRVEVSPEPAPRVAEEAKPPAEAIVEPTPPTVPEAAVPEPSEPEVAEPTPPVVPEAPEASPQAAPEAAPEVAPEAAPKDLAEPTPPTVPEAPPESAPKEQAEPAPAAPVQPPAAELPAAEPDKDVIARAPEATVPARPLPTPEVVRMCGAGDTACQDELTALLADPAHKWMNAQPSPREERSGVRILAYRVLAPTLGCEDLRRGLLETLSDTGETPSEATPPAPEGGKSLAWVQLLRRAVELELRSEIDRRCQ